VTEKWLNDNGFKYHGLITDKPRIKDAQEYVWIDNIPIRGITYKGKWSPIVEKQLFCDEVKSMLMFKK